MALFDTPNPPNSPLEKLYVPRKEWAGTGPTEWATLLREEGVDPDLAEKLARAFHRRSEQQLLDAEANYREVEHWANIHTHTSGGGSLALPPLDSQRTMLVGADNNRLRRLWLADGTQKWETTLTDLYPHPGIEPVTGKVVSHTSGTNEVVVLDPDTGAVLQQFAAGTPAGAFNPQKFVVDRDGNAYFMLRPTSSEGRLRKYDLAAGTITWDVIVPNGAHIREMWTTYDGTGLFAITHGDHRLHQVDKGTGAFTQLGQWASSTGAGASPSDNGIVLFAESLVKRYNSDMVLQWETSLGTNVNDYGISIDLRDDTIWAGRSAGGVARISPDGATVDVYPGGTEATGGLAVTLDGSRLFLSRYSSTVGGQKPELITTDDPITQLWSNTVAVFRHHVTGYIET